MRIKGKTIGRLLFLSGCLVLAVAMLIVSDYGLEQAFAGQSAVKVLFEDKQARVKIIKTAAGVILKITTDNQGRTTVKEMERYPAAPLSETYRH